MNLYEKIQAVADEIRSVEKDMQVGNATYGYKAVSDFNVTTKVKEAESKYKLISIPVNQEMISSETIRILEKEKERILYSFVVKMRTRLIDTENPTDFIEIESLGHGLDSGDKAFGKASTYARKYALLNAYKIATSEDPDANPSEPKTTAHIDTKRDVVFSYFNKNNQSMQNILGHFKVGQMEDLNQMQIDRIYKNMITQKLI